MLPGLQRAGQWLRPLPRRAERSTLSLPSPVARRVSSLDVTLGADVLVSLTVMLTVLTAPMEVPIALSVVIGTATVTAARSYIRYQRVRVR